MASIDPDELRPRRYWYGVAAAVAVLGLAGAVGSTVFIARSIAGAVHSVEALDPGLRPLLVGRPTVVDLEPGLQRAVYVAGAGGGVSTGGGASAGRPPPPVSCGGNGLTVTDVQDEITAVVDGTRWREVQLVRASEPGPHEIVCSTTDRTADLALGTALDADAAARAGRQVGRAVVASLAVVGLGGIGVLAGGLIALVAAVRRSSHRSALLTQRRYGAQLPPYR